MRSRTRSQRTSGAGRLLRCASRIARSTATQHITRELRYGRSPARTSQIPWSGRCQFSHTHSTIPASRSQKSYATGWAYLS
jgi:hypothetical protein